jgi:membrane protein DedA with SNARE-associated domain
LSRKVSGTLLNTTALYHYFGIFIALVAAGIGFPIPEEIPVVTGGVLVGNNQDELRWWIMLPVCIAGVVISDGLLYGIGRLWGPRLLEYRWIKTRLLPRERLEHIEDNFHRYGVKILLFARFLPAIRSPIFITAGLMRVPLTRFLLADGIYAIPGVSLLFSLGFWFTDQFMAALQRAESYRPLVVVVILAAVGSYLFYHFVQRPVAIGDPQELPVIGGQVAKLAPPAPDPSLNHAPANPDGTMTPVLDRTHAQPEPGHRGS